MKFSSALLMSFIAQAIALDTHTLHRRARTKSLLINPAGQPPLPSLSQATEASTAANLNLDNIQGDILIGMKKNKELFYFFSINDAAAFKTHLANDIHPLITTTTQLLSNDTQPLTFVNIAFSKAGLDTLGITDSLEDPLFINGQAGDATALGDPGTTNWVSTFADTQALHGVFLFGSDTVDNINTTVTSLQATLGSSITQLYSLLGEARPGAEQGHEHFGFKDGIAQPAVNGFGPSPSPGQSTLDAGHILLGQTGDATTRPSWALEGSFLVFRQLKQLVPEFNTFLANNPLNISGLTPSQGSDLLGARMFGRWKSGAPVDLAPLFDDPTLGADSERNNDFDFTHPNKTFTSDQSECPFSAHIRKTNPRADFGTSFSNHIIRAGIPYGPEVTDSEATSGASDPTIERGLAFVAYQSDIGVGFHTLQAIWADSPSFVFGKDVQPGFDPIIGANHGQSRTVVGLDPNNPTGNITLPIDFVVSRGGEYFFSPSLDAILNTLAV